MCTMTTVVKTEISSSPGSSYSCSSKKLDIIDKWRARVLFCGRSDDQEDRDDSMCKKIEKHMAVLRVAYPFLTERQLRGKAWKSCGLKSIMGGIPRVGLSPKIKKELIKQEKSVRKKDSYLSKIFQKPRIKKEKIKSEMNLQKCPFEFQSPSIDKNSGASPSDYSQASQLSELKNLPQSLTKKTPNASSYKVVFTPNSEEEMESTQGNEILSKHKSLFSYIKPQNYFGFKTIETSLNSGGNCFTQSQTQDNDVNSKENFNLATTQNLIDEQSSFSTTLPSINTIHPVYSKLTAYNTPSQANATINTVLDLNSSCLLETTPDSQRILPETTPLKSRSASARQKITFQDVPEDHDKDTEDCSLTTQDLLKAAMMDCEIVPGTNKVDSSICSQVKEADLEKSEKIFQSEDINNTFFGFTNENSRTDVNSDMFGSLLKNEIYSYQNSCKKRKICIQEVNSYDCLPISPFQSQDVLTQSISQTMVLPPSTMLSNYCSEYNLAYTKPDLKPHVYRDSYSSDSKSGSDRAVPLGQSLEEFFKARDMSFRKVKSEVRKKVVKILEFLDKDIQD